MEHRHVETSRDAYMVTENKLRPSIGGVLKPAWVGGGQCACWRLGVRGSWGRGGSPACGEILGNIAVLVVVVVRGNVAVLALLGVAVLVDPVDVIELERGAWRACQCFLLVLAFPTLQASLSLHMSGT